MRITITSLEKNGSTKKLTIAPINADIQFIKTLDTNSLISDELDKEILYLVCGIFTLESLLRDGRYKNKQIDKSLTYNIDIEINYLEQGLNQKLETIIYYLLTFSLGVMIKVKVIINQFSLNTNQLNDIKNEGSICLFSGGADSFTGILNAKWKFGETTGIFVSHAMLRKLVEKKLTPYMAEQDININIIKIPKGRSALQQMRGFVYTAIAGIFAHSKGLNKIIVSEIGPIMFQPAYDILDEVTITTHPITLRLTKMFLEIFYKEKFEIITPFKNLTKAEAVSLVKDYNVIKLTNSCRSTRYSNSDHQNCGCCLGCIIRRISLIVSGIENENDDNYAYDVFLKGEGEPVLGRKKGLKIKSKNFSELYQILNFADSIIRKSVSSISKIKIDEYNLNDLFFRFSLDVFSAAYLMYDKQSIGKNPLVKEKYFALLKDSLIDVTLLEKRISEVRSNKYKPIY